MSASIIAHGVTIYDPTKAWNGYTLFDGRNQMTYLIDMNGNEVNSWPYQGFPSEMISPDINDGVKGHVILQKEPNTFDNETLLKLDWDGNIVWQWGEKAPGGRARQNHDQSPLPNGNLMVLSMLEHVNPDIGPDPINDQAIYEVNPEGEIVWQWVSSEHIEELGFTGEKRELVLSKKSRPRAAMFLINDVQPLGPNKWHDGGDGRFHPDNVMIDCREANVIAIIEKSSGKIVWRLGPDYPASYDLTAKTLTGDLPRPIDCISGQHDAHMIRQGNPGAGNILVFDNQGPAGFPPVHLGLFLASRILEIDPITEQIVWQYDASCSNRALWKFYSSFISGAQRLPNGNTLICEGMNGRLFQVTTEGEIVWEYINPHYGPFEAHMMSIGTDHTNYVFRAQPIPYDWVPEDTSRSEVAVTPVGNPGIPDQE